MLIPSLSLFCIARMAMESLANFLAETMLHMGVRFINIITQPILATSLLPLVWGILQL